jgi:hypothetical protein
VGLRMLNHVVQYGRDGRRDARVWSRRGDRAAAIHSVIGSAKLNGPDPEGYLRDAHTPGALAS